MYSGCNKVSGLFNPFVRLRDQTQTKDKVWLCKSFFFKLRISLEKMSMKSEIKVIGLQCENNFRVHLKNCIT